MWISSTRRVHGHRTPGFSTPQPLAGGRHWLTSARPENHARNSLCKGEAHHRQAVQAGSFPARFDNILIKQIASN